MSYNNTGRYAPPRSENPLLVGILIGVVLGLAIAGGVAWLIQGSGTSVLTPASTPSAKPSPATTLAPAPASSVSADKPRFEFYKVLTDKQDASPSSQKGDKAALTGSKPGSEQLQPAAPREIYYLQAGSFPSAEDADKLKAKLAMLGMEASIQVATIPDKGVWHRVRLGPYKSREEVESTRTVLMQNGVNAAPIRAQ